MAAIPRYITCIIDRVDTRLICDKPQPRLKIVLPALSWTFNTRSYHKASVLAGEEAI